MAQQEVRRRYLKRQGMVEPVFSQLKCRQGLRRFRRKGLKAVRCEFALHAMAYNLSRAVALWARDVLSLSQSLQKIRRMGKGPKGRAHHHTAES